MSGSLAVHFRAIVLPCLMLLGVLGISSQAEGATFRYDPITYPNPAENAQPYEAYPTAIRDGVGGVAGDQNFLLDSFNHVRFRVTQIFTPITKVTIRMVIPHEHINDLRIALISPDNTNVPLVNGIGSVGSASVNILLGGFGTLTGGVDYVEFTPSNTPTPPSITDPRSIINNQSYVPPGLYLPSGNLSLFNGKVNAQANGIWRLKIEDTRDINDQDEGIFYDARLYITQQGGERIWTGAGNNNLWSNGENWDALFGKPDPTQSNALVFPSNVPRFAPVNDFNGGGQTQIAVIAQPNYPSVAPFFDVPTLDSTAQVGISLTGQAWTTLFVAADVGDLLRITNDSVVGANGDFRIVAINETSGTMTVVRYIPTAAGTTKITAGGGPTATMQVFRNLSQLDVSGVKFIGGDYTVTGGGVTVTDRAQFINAVGLNVWAIPSIIEDGEVILDSQGSGMLTLSGVWSGAGGLTKTGIAPVVLSGANTYGGNNLVSQGILDLVNNTALGSAAGSTVVKGGTVRVTAGLTVNEPIVIGGPGFSTLAAPTPIGALVFVAGGTWTGVTLDPERPSTLNVQSGAVTLTNIVALTPITPIKSHFLTVTNGGTLAINGALPTITNLTLKGGAATFGAAQPNIRDLTVSGGADIALGADMTVSGVITSEAAADASNITGGNNLNLGAVGHNIVVGGGAAGAGGGTNITSSDLFISAPMTNGSFIKSGGGVLRVTGVSTGVGATVSQGALAGTGTLGAISIANGAVLSPAGTLATTSLNLASGSALILPTGANPQINASGAVILTNSVLQPYSGAGATIINAASVTGEFVGKANGAGITYNPTSVILAGLAGSWAFAPDTVFTVDESVGTLQVTLVGSGANPVLRNFGGGVREGVDLRLVGAPTSGTVTFTIPIIDNFIDSGDQTTTLAIVPQDGSLITNSATLTIIDNDKSDQKKCGFGTGLTVFLLLGFGLFFQLRLRRR